MTIAAILLTATVMAKPSGALFIDGMGIARCEAGTWHSLANPLSAGTAHPNADSQMKTFHKKGAWALTMSGVRRASFGPPVFLGLDNPPGERGWFIDPFDKYPGHWIGDKPTTAKWKRGSNQSETYVKVAKSFLATKGFKSANPILQDVILADFDGDGTQESLVIGASRKSFNMHEAFQGNLPTRKPNDYAFAILRRLERGKVQTTTLYYSDGRKSGVEGKCEFVGAWNIDGGKEAEFVIRWSGYEAWSTSVYRLASGKVSKLVEAGDGV